MEKREKKTRKRRRLHKNATPQETSTTKTQTDPATLLNSRTIRIDNNKEESLARKGKE
jgi:hypothetical protein